MPMWHHYSSPHLNSNWDQISINKIVIKWLYSHKVRHYVTVPFSNGNFGSPWFIKKGPDVSVTSGFPPSSPMTLLVVANVTAEYPKLWGSILSTIHSISLQVWMVVEWVVLNQGPYALYKPHWFPIRFWLQFRMLLIIFKVLHGIGPVYLWGHLLIKVYVCPICTLDPLTEIMLLCGIQEMDFIVATPILWNNLSPTI